LRKTLEDKGVFTHVGPSCIDALNKKILFMHEPVEVEVLFESNKYDLICFGHTHEIVNIEKKGRFLINPGETCGLISGKKTIAVVDFDKGATIINL